MSSNYIKPTLTPNQIGTLVDDVSSNLQSQIAVLSSSTVNNFIHLSGDTMTGNLSVTNIGFLSANISIGESLFSTNASLTLTINGSTLYIPLYTI